MCHGSIFNGQNSEVARLGRRLFGGSFHVAVPTAHQVGIAYAYMAKIIYRSTRFYAAG